MKNNKNNLTVLIPGYKISFTIRIPEFHPFALWQTSYLKYLLEKNIEKKPIENHEEFPWPITQSENVAPFYIQQLKETIFTSLIKINQIYTSYNQCVWVKEGRNNFEDPDKLQNKFLKETEKTISLFCSAIDGSTIDINIYKKYKKKYKQQINNEKDLNQHSNKIKEYYEIQPKINFKYIFKRHRNSKICFPYLHSKEDHEIKINNQLLYLPVNIRKKNPLIPSDLTPLENSFLTLYPDLFPSRSEEQYPEFDWKPSIIEVFYKNLEKITLSLQSNPEKEIKKDFLNLKKLLDNKKKWEEWYQEGEYITPVFSQEHFPTLKEIFQDASEKDWIIIVSSFLNPNNAKDFIDFISHYKGKMIIIFGHPNLKDIEEVRKQIQVYREKIKTINPKIIKQIMIIPSRYRSHEKLVLSTQGYWLSGSWNATSNQIQNNQLEISIFGKSIKFVEKLLTLIEELFPEEYIQLHKNFKEQLTSVKNQIEPYIREIQQEEFKKLFQQLKDSVSRLEENNTLYSQEHIKQILKTIYMNLAPFLLKSRLTLIDQRLTQKCILNQIEKTKKTIIFTSDTITEKFFRNWKILESLKQETPLKKSIYIMWGRFAKKEDRKLNEENRILIREGENAIKIARLSLKKQCFCINQPSRNHSKIMIIDNLRILVTSENFMKTGTEKTKFEARELGILVENIIFTRFSQNYIANWPPAKEIFPEEFQKECNYFLQFIFKKTIESNPHLFSYTKLNSFRNWVIQRYTQLYNILY